MKFKRGDKVLCIDNDNVLSSSLSLKKIYTIREVANKGQFIRLEESHFSFLAKRFKKVSRIEKALYE
jgi:hypothetical protein